MPGSNPRPAPNRQIPRPRLLARLTATQHPITLIEAPAGCGKTWLLRQYAAQFGIPLHRSGSPPPGAPVMVWDVPHNAGKIRLPELTPGSRLILAKRPSVRLKHLARAEVYGEVLRLAPQELLFDLTELEGHVPQPARVMAQTGGWPCLLGTDRLSPQLIEQFLREEILTHMDTKSLTALSIFLTKDDPTLPSAALMDLPFVAPTPTTPVPAEILAHLQNAAQHELTLRVQKSPRKARTIARSQHKLGYPALAIQSYQALGDLDAALEVLAQEHGPFFSLLHGEQVTAEILNGFPHKLLRKNDLLVLCRTMQAAKQGEVGLARRIMADRWGEVALDTITMLTEAKSLPSEVRFFRFMLHTWEESEGDARYLELGYDLLAALPAQDVLRHGAFYNALVEFYAQARRFAEAEHVAIRAAGWYEKANAPLLCFYISLHRGIGALFLGDPTAATHHAQAAERALRQVSFDCAADARLLALLQACVAYETGKGEPLARFMSQDLDDLAQGEIWPSLVELILTYGSQSLAEHYSTAAARTFLDRWRVAQDRLKQFQMLIDIREIIVLQNGNRWHEAETHARALPTRISRDFVESAGADLCVLQDRDEVAMAMFWLRQVTQERCKSPALAGQLRALLSNPYLTARQRIGAEIWLAHSLHFCGEKADARAQLTRTLVAADRAGSLAILSEERMFIADLTSAQRQREILERSDAVRRVLRKLAQIGPGRAQRGQAMGITRQEMRVLNVLAEGLTDKAIANRLHLSEATVKFHLRNLYRKLGTPTRREAVTKAAECKLLS